MILWKMLVLWCIWFIPPQNCLEKYSSALFALCHLLSRADENRKNKRDVAQLICAARWSRQSAERLDFLWASERISPFSMIVFFFWRVWPAPTFVSGTMQWQQPRETAPTRTKALSEKWRGSGGNVVALRTSLKAARLRRRNATW